MCTPVVLWFLLATFTIIHAKEGGSPPSNVPEPPPSYPPGKFRKLNLAPRILCSSKTNWDTDLCNVDFNNITLKVFPWQRTSSLAECRIYSSTYGDESYIKYYNHKNEVPPNASIRCSIDALFYDNGTGKDEDTRLNFFNTDLEGHIGVVQYGGDPPKA